MIDVRPFIDSSRSDLAAYVSGVDSFVDSLGGEGKLEKSPLREKRPDDYIRNMLAVGVVSRLNREAFLAADKRIIILPDCLKNYGEEACCKADLGNATECTQCNSNCLVFEAMERFSDSRTSMVLEPEDMDAYFADTRVKFGTVGIVGVACALTMLSGFHTTLKYKLPTQGVFLNYAGCQHHWSDPGINTSFSFRRMAWVLGKPHSGEPDMFRGRGATYSLEKQPLSPTDFYERIDALAGKFETEYMPLFKTAYPKADLSELSMEISRAIVPDLITRDSA